MERNKTKIPEKIKVGRPEIQQGSVIFKRTGRNSRVVKHGGLHRRKSLHTAFPLLLARTCAMAQGDRTAGLGSEADYVLASPHYVLAPHTKSWSPPSSWKMQLQDICASSSHRLFPYSFSLFCWGCCGSAQWVTSGGDPSVECYQDGTQACGLVPTIQFAA